MDTPSEPMFYTGETSWFKQIELRDLGDLSALAPFESDLTGLGFEPLGAFVASALTKGVNSAWLHRSAYVECLLLVITIESSVRVVGIFLDSTFADGASLTTTSSKALANRVTARGYRRVFDWTNLYNLYQEHTASVDELQAKHGPPVPISETLLDLVKRMDVATLRHDES